MDSEGDVKIAALATSFAIEQFDASEQRILAYLGSSVLSRWNEIPLDTRQRILNGDAVQGIFDESMVKARIAQLLASDGNEPRKDKRPIPMRPGITRVGRDDEDFVDRAKTAYKQDGGAGEPAHYSHINEFEGKRVVVLRNKRGVLAVYEDVEGLVTRLARWPISWV
ncbi:hypothetical protein RAS12_15995 [Achromobacter seleniivolatilans]|uniref:Uncharacterized protein n=1 Tax=Achromobacter seleniivolatilans TaxID=3047478 RepID=A0ABY9LU60_9BURK|nr:hypothetical protein [Achromobacter sp. R39]WMD18155.1 hypothetical protein RAS12_15995 [Achromobacter sp. R39]